MKKLTALLLLLLLPLSVSSRIFESSEEIQLNPTAGSYVGVSGTVNRFRVNGGVLQFSNNSGVSWGDFFSLSSIAATNGQTLLGNGTGLQIGTITGTADQVNVTLGSGTLGLSLPQSIATTSSPTFSQPVFTDGAVIGTGVGASLIFTNSIPTIKTDSAAGKTLLLQSSSVAGSAHANLQLNASGINSGDFVANAGSGAGRFVVRTGAADVAFVDQTGQFRQSDFAASMAIITNAGSGLATSATVSSTELGYLDGVTSAVQTQLNAKQGTLTDSAGLLAALSDETGTGLAVFSTNPVLTAPEIADYILYGEIVTPSNPAANKHKCYFKTADNLYYCLNSSGVEAQIGGGGIGGSANQLVYATGTAGSGSSEGAFTYDPTLNQLNLDGDFKIGVSGTPATKLEVEGAISSNGIGVLADNLALDGGFEDGANFTCSHTDQTCAIATTNVLMGAGYQVIDASSSQTYNGRYCVTNTQWAGRNIQITADMKTTSTIMSLCASYNDSATLTGDNCTQYVVNSTTAWLPIRTTMTVPTSGVMCARLISSAGSTDDVGLDNIKFEPLKTQDISKLYEQSVSGIFDPASMTTTSGDLRFGTVTLVGDTLLTYTDSNGRFTNNTARNITPKINFSGRTSTVGNIIGISRNGTVINRSQDNVASIINHVTSSFLLTPGQYFTVTSTDALTSGISQYLSITANSVEQDQVLTASAPEAQEIRFYNDTNCSPSIDGASYQDFVDTDCDFATASKTANVVTPTTAGAMALKQTLVKAGTYKVFFSGTMHANNTATQECAYRLYDGTNIIGPTHGASDGTSVNGFAPGASGIVTYTSDQSNLEWKLQGYEVVNAVTPGCAVIANNTLAAMTISMTPVSGTMAATLSEKVVIAGVSKPVTGIALIADGGNCTSSPCTISNQFGTSWLSSCTRSGLGVYVCTITAGKFSSTPSCVGGGNSEETIINATSATNISVICKASGGASQDCKFNLNCTGIAP